MKTKNILGIFGAALAVSFGALSYAKSYKIAQAAGVIDLGTMTFTGANGDSTITNLYGTPSSNPNFDVLPSGWDSAAFAPVDNNSGTFINGTRVGNEIKKLRYNCYYIQVTGASVGSIATVKGSWANSQYKFTIEEFSVQWNGYCWLNAVDVPELEPYDVITLSDTCFEDKNKESFGTTDMVPSAWNTYALSSENTRNSFVYQFKFESFGEAKGMKGTLDIKLGGNGAWDAGHFYQLSLINSWGPSGQMLFSEKYGTNTEMKFEEQQVLNCNLNPGSKHTIEFASIYAKNQDKTYDYVKYDGTIFYHALKNPYSHERTTKVTYNYGGTDVFFGSVATEEKENTQILQYSYLNETKDGVYLNGTLNDIPVNGSDVKGAPVNKNNALLNGEPLYEFNSGNPFTKIGNGEEDCYFLDLKPGKVALKEGDVITLSDEFRFYYNGRGYRMNVVPISFLYSNNQMSELSDVRDYLYKKIATHCDLDNYYPDKVLRIQEIVTEAESKLKDSSLKMKAVWDLYHGYIEELDAIPYTEEKQQEILNNAKEAAKAELNALADSNNYMPDDFDTVQGYVNDAIEQIDSEQTNTVKMVEDILAHAKELIAAVKTKIEYAEEALTEYGLTEDTVQFLEDFERVTTSDLCATGDLVFHQKGGDEYTYHSGGYDDTSTKIVTSKDNINGNMVFQFYYESDDPSARSLIRDGGEERFGAQIFIRMRGVSDTDAYRFDIATITGDEDNAGVALGSFIDDVSVGRITYNAKLQANQRYKIECGSIDLKGYERTLLFMKIDDELVISTLVDSLEESAPSIRITDSYADGTHYAKMSPIEEGTSKKDYSTLLGRLVLDEEASIEGKLIVSLRDNAIPEGAQLYPLEAGAIKINGEEVPMKDVHPSTYIQKNGQNKYAVILSGYELNDNDVISVGGYFSAYDIETETKSVYQLFETSFTYHEASDSWEQPAPTDRKVIVFEAKETISHYANLDNYSEEAKEEINQLVEYYLALIDETETESINAVVEQALQAIDAVNTLLDDYKEYAKDLLASYKSADLYRDEEKAELAQILENAYSRIDSCTDEASIDLILGQTTLEIDQLKTAAERDAEDLAAAKRAAKNAIDAYAGLLELNRYSDENATLLTSMTYQALDDVDAATSIEEVNNIVETYKEAVKEVKTKDGSTFDGEKYIEKKKSKGCGGSVIAGSTVTFIALFGAIALLLIKKFKEN